MAQDPRALLQKADKAAAGAGGGFSLFGGRTEKYENAADLYTQAANAFRMQKQTKEAGQAFERAAAIQSKYLNEPDDAANTLIEAFKVYRKTDPEDAVRVIDVSINHYTGKGNFRRAATHKQNQAEVYEEIGDRMRAMEAYELAASWFESDNAEALANKLFLKVGDLAAMETIPEVKEDKNLDKVMGENDIKYGKAIENFEKVARSSVSNNLMKWSVKDYFLKAGLCLLAIRDKSRTEKALEDYLSLDPTFLNTREHQLLVDLHEASHALDVDVFIAKLKAYEQMSSLDKWKVTMMLRIKTRMENADEDFS